MLQQRLNRKTVSAKLIADFPAHLRAYDLLRTATRICAALPSSNGARGWNDFVARLNDPRIDLSPLFRSQPGTSCGSA